MSTPRIVPICTVEVDGREIPPEAKSDIQSVVVEQLRDGADSFVLEINNEAFWSDSDVFTEGKKVKILMGYLGETPEVVFEGEILKREVLFPPSGASRLWVSGFDASHRLRRTYHQRSFRQVTDSELAQKIASECGLTAEVDTTTVRREWVYQINQTNLEFLRERAKLLNYDVKLAGKKLIFKKPQTSKKEVAKLKWGENLLSFRPRLSTANVAPEVEVRVWDSDQKKDLVGKANKADAGDRLGSTLGLELMSKSFGAAVRSISNQPVATLAEAETLAKAKLAEAAMDFVVGEGHCRGEPLLKAGALILVDGVGKRFAGKYVLDSVEHRVDKTGYLSHFTVARNAVEDGPPPTLSPTEVSRQVAEAKAEKPNESKPEAVVVNARWSKERAKEGQAVLMRAEVYHLDPGAPVNFKIFQRGQGGKTQFVEEKSGQVSGTEASCAWSYTYQEGRELQPADFFFKASAGGKEANSGFLQVRNEAKVDASIGDTDIPLSGALFEAKLPDGSVFRGRLDEKGQAALPPLSPGKFEVTFPDS